MSQDWQDPYAEDAEPYNAVQASEQAPKDEIEPSASQVDGGTRSPFEPEASERDEPFILSSFTAETPEEKMRRFSLGWSAGVAFCVAIAFMAFLGWLVDLLIGATPWGIITGVVIGAGLGIFQLFRITSRIFPDNSTLKVNPLLSPPDKQD